MRRIAETRSSSMRTMTGKRIKENNQSKTEHYLFTLLVLVCRKSSSWDGSPWRDQRMIIRNGSVI